MATEGLADRARAGLLRAAANRRDLWYAYVNCGGGAGYIEFEAYLYGALTPPRLEALALEQTLWEVRQFGVERWP